MKLTADLIADSPQFFNANKDWELDMRANKIPVLENLGCTLDQFDVIDFSDNDIRKIEGFPVLRRLKTLFFNNNKIIRIGEGLEQLLPNLRELMLTNNALQELSDLDPLATIKTLTHISLLRNPVTARKHYRLYMIHMLPNLKVLDFQKVKQKEREEAERVFGGKQGKQLAQELGRASRTFLPGGGSAIAAGRGGERARQASMDVQAIRAAIAQAKSLDEVRRLEMMLQQGQIPGRERFGGPMDDIRMHVNGPS